MTKVYNLRDFSDLKYRNRTYLSQDEICFLNNWDAEKYRQLL